MRTGQLNITERDGAAFPINTAQLSRSARVTTPPALLHKTKENINRLINPLTQKNWMQAFVDIARHQPNLSKIVSVLDMLLPRSPNAEAECLGFAFNGNHQFEGSQPAAMKMKVAANGHLYQQRTSENTAGRIERMLHRFAGRTSTVITQEPTLKLAIDSELEAKGEITYVERLKVIQKLVCFALDKEEKSTVLVEKKAHLDVDEKTCNKILQVLLSNSASNPPMNWLEHLKTALLPRTTDTNSSNAACLSEKQIERVLKLHPNLIELVSALDLLTLPGKENNIQSKHTFGIFEQEDFIIEAGEKLGDQKFYLPTLANKLNRSILIDQPYVVLEGETLTHKPAYIYELPDGSQTGFENKGTLLTFLADRAVQQLQSTDRSPICEFSDLLPIHILQLISNLSQIPVPNWVVAYQNSVHTAKQEYQVEQMAKKLAAEHQRHQQKLQDEAHRKQLRQRHLEKGIPQEFVDDNQLLMLIDAGSNNQRIEENTYDIQMALSALEMDCVNTTLNNQFTHINMAHNSRGAKVIQGAHNQNKTPYFIKDNECWNRATWLSVFEQISHGDDMAKRIADAKINSKPSSERLQLVAKTVVDGYLLADQINGCSRLHFLHHGEEESLNRAPAHFRTGQSISEFCKEFGLDDIVARHPSLFPQRPKTPAPKIEQLLKYAVFALASGVYGSVRELKSLKYMPGSMATSDIPAAVHRALGLPCIIIENNRYQSEMNLRVAGPNNHELHELLSRMPKNKEGLPQFTKPNLESLLVKGKVPIIHLESITPNDGHFTVYLPNNTALANQINFVTNTEFTLQKTEDIVIAKPPARKLDAAKAAVKLAYTKNDKVVAIEGEYYPLEFPNSEKFQLLSTRETDEKDPLSVVRHAVAISENPVVFDFISPSSLKGKGLPALSAFLSEKTKDGVRVDLTKAPPEPNNMSSPMSGWFHFNDNQQGNNWGKVYKITVPQSLLGEAAQRSKEKMRTLTLIEFEWPPSKQFDQTDRQKRLKTANIQLNQFLGEGVTPIIRANSTENPQTALSLLNLYTNNQRNTNMSFKKFYLDLKKSHTQNIPIFLAGDKTDNIDLYESCRKIAEEN